VRVDRLVVIGGTPCFCLAAGWAAGVPPQAVRAMRTGLRSRPESTLGRFFEDVMFPRGDAADAARSRVRHALSAAPGALVHGLDYLRRTDLRNQLKAVDIPVLVIHGRQDRIVPWEAGRFLAGHLAGSRFVLYDSFGHNLPGDDPGAVARDIAEFLEAEN
jgi:pimeloyl-[acyl-carrier protein] methyl ester esterase